MYRFALITALVVSAFAGAAFGLELYPSEDRGFSNLIANGAIGLGDLPKLKTILQYNVRRKTPTVIYLTSQGGALETVKGVADVILAESDALFQATGRSNLIVINEECSSACAVLTAMLTHRRDARSLGFMVTPSAQFGLHAGAIGEMINGKFVEDKTPGLQEEAIENQLKALHAAGINPDWLKKNDEIFRRREFTMLKGAQLCSENSLIIPPDACLPDDRDVIPLVEQRMRAAPVKRKTP